MSSRIKAEQKSIFNFSTRLLPSEHIYLWNSFVREKKKTSISRVDESVYPETKLARSSSNSSSGIETDSDSGSSGFDEMADDSRLTIAEIIKKMGADPIVARVPKTARNKLERHSSGFSEVQNQTSIR